MSLVKSANSSVRGVRPFAFEGKLASGQAADAKAASPHDSEAKSGQARPVGTAKPSAVDMEAYFLDRVAKLEEELAAKNKEIETAKAKAYDEGFKAGESAAVKQSSEAIGALEEAIAEGLKTLEAKLDDQLETSIAIARAILQRILGEAAELPAHVLAAAARCKQELAHSSVLKIRVSATDFPDDAALALLKHEFKGIDVIAEEGLDRGACLFDLKLGVFDASIFNQLDNAETFLIHSLKQAGARR